MPMVHTFADENKLVELLVCAHSCRSTAGFLCTISGPGAEPHASREVAFVGLASEIKAAKAAIAACTSGRKRMCLVRVLTIFLLYVNGMSVEV
jgi:hypothetical protein